MKTRIGRAFAAVLLVSVCVSWAFAEDPADKRRDTILYGLEGDVIELIGTLKAEKDYSYNDEVLSLYAKSRNSSVREAIIGYFGEQKNAGLKEACLEVLEDPYEQKKTTVNAFIDYVKAVPVPEAAPLLRRIIENDNDDYRGKAISALGKVGVSEDAAFLVDYLDGDIEGDEKSRLIIRQSVMTALGELQADGTADRLMEIAKDRDENAVIRATAATALGRMGRQDAVPVLVSLFSETDPVLRAASITGLSKFADGDAEARAVLLEGLKDSYYKVRMEALDVVGKAKNADAIPYILFRAKNDPEESVKQKAVDVLALFGDSASNAWLLETMKNEKTPDGMRVKIASVLLENDRPFAYPAYEEILLAAVKDDKKKNLRYGLGRLLKEKKIEGSARVAEAFLASKDAATKAMGLDMFAQQRYPELAPTVEAIANDEKSGALQGKAKKILGTSGSDTVSSESTSKAD